MKKRTDPASHILVYVKSVRLHTGHEHAIALQLMNSAKSGCKRHPSLAEWKENLFSFLLNL